MNQTIPHPYHVSPRHVRILGPCFLFHPPRCFTDNLHALEQCQGQLAITKKGCRGLALGKLPRLAIRSQHVGQPEVVATLRHIR
jgi:hypothetical protein